MKYLFYVFALTMMFSCGEKESKNLKLLEHELLPQLFTIDAKRDTIIVGSNGTKIKFTANSFSNNNDLDISESVQVELKEFYSTQDFLNNRLSTNTTDGRILKSSGMVYIQATSSANEILSLKDDHPMMIMFRRNQDSRTANLFAGEKGKYNEIKWNVLEPVHNDTIVMEKKTVTLKAYGGDDVRIETIIIIGNDTIEWADENSGDFKTIFNRMPDIKSQNEIEYSDTYDSTIANSLNRSNPYDPEKFYIFETTRLGYLNCDIFIDKTQNLVVSIESGKQDLDIFIVLNKLKSVLFPDSINENGTQYFFIIPKNIDITVVSYLKDDDKHFFDLMATNSSSNNITIKLREKKLDKIREEVKKLE